MAFKSLVLVGAVAALLSSIPAFSSSYNDSGVVDPMIIESERPSTSSLLARVLSQPEADKQYQGVVGFIEHYGEWVTLEGEGVNPKVHVSSYLLQTGKSELAAALLKNNVLPGWLSYRFMDGVANDFMFALKGGHRAYLDALFKYAPRGLNTPMSIQLNGEKVLPLSLLATREYMDMPFYDDIVMSMLDSGANPHQKMSTGLSPMIVASSSNNMRFVRVVQTHLAGQTRSLEGLLRNTPLEESELIEMQAIADTFIEESAERKASYDYGRLFDMWVQMILKGYNLPADLLYEELRSRQEFKIDGYSSGKMTPLMAAVMSPLYGGNVEYAKRLIERGADPRVLIEAPAGESGQSIMVNYIQLALPRDNFKVVALMIANQVGFVVAPDDDNVLILTEAMEQKAYISAAILKEALVNIVKYDAERKGL